MLEIVLELGCHALEDFHRLARDLHADPVPGQNEYVQFHRRNYRRFRRMPGGGARTPCGCKGCPYCWPKACCPGGYGNGWAAAPYAEVAGWSAWPSGKGFQ